MVIRNQGKYAITELSQRPVGIPAAVRGWGHSAVGRASAVVLEAVAAVDDPEEGPS